MRKLATIALFLLTACPGAKPIKELLDDPGRYDGKVVRIAGEVSKSIGALGYGGYQLNDGTGTKWPPGSDTIAASPPPSRYLAAQ